MRNRFDRELDLLHQELIEMGAMIESNIAAAIDALMKKDARKAQAAIDADPEVDEKERTIERHCLRLLLQQQPVASDLRRISTALKMITDMERIGDHAENIVEYTRNHVENGVSYSDAALAEMREVAERVDTILHDALYIFNRHSALPGELDQLTEKEEEIDQLTDQLRDRHIQRLNEGLCSPESGMDFVDLLINLERVSDHATNIAYSVAN